MALNIYYALGDLVRLLELFVLASCILSWVPLSIRSNPIASFILRVTEPMLAPIRAMVQRSPLGGPGMMIDISPIILLLIINGVYALIGRFIGML